jgi:glutathione synthase/RimK-type ligase-like ATP-grasp enzyme
MSKFGIAPGRPTKEGRELIAAARSHYDQVITINPHNIWATFENGGNSVVFHGKENISDLDTLVVRRTSGHGAALSVLVRALDRNGCNVVDPVTRYSVGFASKLKTAIRRVDEGSGPNSYFAFSNPCAQDMLTHVRRAGIFPMIIKPIDGKRSAGKIIVNTAKTSRSIVSKFFADRESADMPLFMQKFENIVREYRIMLVDGAAITGVEKNKKNNRTTGSQFIPIQNEPDTLAVLRGCREFCSDKGIVGVDIGLCSDGRIVVIEENRAPGWDRLDVAGVNVANAIIEKIKPQN